MEEFPLLEALELRLAPATLVDASTAAYTDVDGDEVTVWFSRPVLESQELFEAVFQFEPEGGWPGLI